jgi:predicted RNase H-like nuclease (RuvC/YqgF family)
MEWYVWVAIIALGVGIWHEFINFPATSESIHNLRERLDNIESENSDLRQQIIALEQELLELTHLIDEIKNPAYHDALKYGDAHALWQISETK